MSFDPLRFGTTRSEHIPTLHGTSRGSQRRSRSGGSRATEGRHDTTLAATTPSSFAFAVDGNGLLSRRAGSSHGSRPSSAAHPLYTNIRAHNNSNTNSLDEGRRGVRSGSRSQPPAARVASSSSGVHTGVPGAPGLKEGRTPFLSPSASASFVAASHSGVYSAGASATSLSGLLPSAAALHPFAMRGTRCATKPPLSSSSRPLTAAAARPSSALPAGVSTKKTSSSDDKSNALAHGEGVSSLRRTTRPYSTPASASDSAHGQPRVNNYVVGQSGGVASAVRESVTGRAGPAQHRPPRVPGATTATSAAAAAILMEASAFTPHDSPSATSSSPAPSSSTADCNAADASEKVNLDESSQQRKDEQRRAMQAEEAEVGSEGEEEREEQHPADPSVLPAPSTTSAAAHQLCGVSPAAPTRLPLRRTQPCASSEPSCDTAAAASTAEDEAASSTNESVGSSAAPHPATSSSRPSSSSRRQRPSHIPLLQMTRTNALRRPVLVTKDASTATTTAAAHVATGASRKSTPRSTSSHEPSPPTEHLADSPLAARSLSSAQPHTFARFAPYTPAPPRRPSASQPRRSRKTSLASVVSNSSAALPQQTPPLRSPEADAAATQVFFHAMPSFHDAVGRAASREGKNERVPDDGAAALRDAGGGSDAALRKGSISITSLLHRSGSAVAEQSQLPPPLRRHASRTAPLSRSSSLRSSSSGAVRGASQVGNNVGSTSIVERLRERGNAYMMREEFAQAIATYSEAIRLSPSCDVLWGNRATAFLLTFRYLPAVADCLYVLHWKPGSVKAYWRAAKAYAAAYRFLEAKKYYLLAQQAAGAQDDNAAGSLTSNGLSFTAADATSSKHNSSDRAAATTAAATAAAASAAASSSDNSSAGADGDWKSSHGLDGGRESGSSEGRGNGSKDDNWKQDKVTKERLALAAEAAAVASVDQYWQHVRGERYGEAVAVIDGILAARAGSYRGPTAVSWQALRLEALLPIQPKAALAEAESLHRAFPEALELYYVLAKALFYTAHDAVSTRRCLQLLDDATARRSAQNTLLNVHVRYAAMQLRELGCGGTSTNSNSNYTNNVSSNGSGGDTAAAQLEGWARRNQLREDSRVAELRHTIATFARHRDVGNAAYEKGHWEAAAAAYTQCLQTDRHNTALLAAVHCNRTAVYMQAGRWREALSDADAAIKFSPQLATAHGRRGRILLHLLAQEYEAQRLILSRHFTTQWSAAVKEQLMRYADTAVADLTRAVELSPTAEHKSQLEQALAQRQTVKAALRSAPPGPGTGPQSRPASSSSSSAHARTYSRGGSASANPHHRGTHDSQTGSTAGGQGGGGFPHGFAYQRGYAHHSRPASSPAGASPYSVVQQHLQLLGLSVSDATNGGLPDFTVVAKAYRESALRWHPDKWVTATPAEQQEAERQFKLISVAYTSLRERYSDAAKAS